MVWKTVAYAIDGAQLDGALMRLALFGATGGHEGIMLPADLKVVPLSTPGPGVQVSSGGALVRNRAEGGRRQMYAIENPDSDTQGVAQTGSTGARRDLVAAMVEDPTQIGNAKYAENVTDPLTGPYVFTRIIPNVPAGTRRLQDVPGYEYASGVALARIDLPANTATVTAGMITDLRFLAMPFGSSVMLEGASPTAGVPLTSPTFTAWPTQDTFDVDIPPTATHMIARLEFVAGQTPAQTSGSLRLILGSSTAFGERAYNFSAQANQDRETIVVAGTLKLPDSVKGTSQPLRISALRDSGRTGNLFTVDETYFLAQIQFVERVV